MGRKREPIGQAIGTRKVGQAIETPVTFAMHWRMLLSLAVVLQLLAVVAEPFQFFTRSPRGVSPAAEPIRTLLTPYIEFAYLNHGYFFFAPEPGPSHLIDCRLEFEDGKTALLRFPDRSAQWPRLLYHRHFMMAENLHQLWVPPVDDSLLPANDPLRPLLIADRRRFESVRDSMKRHLLHRYNATQANIDRVEHRLPSSDEVFRGRVRLNDPSLYVTLPDVSPATGEPYDQPWDMPGIRRPSLGPVESLRPQSQKRGGRGRGVALNDNPNLSLLAWLNEWCRAWERFWFVPRLPHTLALIRICCGGMLAYVHLTWASLLPDFMGEYAWIDAATIRKLHESDWAWSWLWYVDSPLILGAHQALAVLAAVAVMLGLGTRIAVPLAWWTTLMVCHRMTLALFGLDQILIMLMMYLMVSRCGAVWSIDAWWRRRRPAAAGWLLPSSDAAVSNNVATRLIQLHLCVIYIFGGLSKMRGEMWFDGSALWYTIVNYEYQSLDVSWLGRYPFVVAGLTAATIFWETFYCALIWPRLTRPIALGMAVLVHAGIAIALGMVTFGFMMIVANLAFVEPGWLLSKWSLRKSSGAAK